LDLGVSSHQIDSPERGFSFRANARLDMRMDRRQLLDGAQIVNSYPEAALEKIFRDFGEEPQARRLARSIVAERQLKAIATTEELTQLVARVKRSHKRDHHPATQVFQALRIAVNDELGELQRFLEYGYDILRPQGRMAIISFHSLEDRLVKTAFRRWAAACLCPPRVLTCRCGWSPKVKLVTKRPLVASVQEVALNPRARSAKLRVVERV
jgi:16S rRNA (cytosine1402-N4)-methyltransferase